MRQTHPRAAVLVIGDEVLAGQTRDINLQNFALLLATRGIEVVQARVIGDEIACIAEHVRALKAEHDLLLTSGGIGPTHDDRTMDGVARAFEVAVSVDAQAFALLQAYYAERNLPFNDARQRMARMPTGARLVNNPISAAPGAWLDNVIVLPGIPATASCMLQGILPDLPQGPVVRTASLVLRRGEGEVAASLRQLADAQPAVRIGCYPGQDESGAFCRIVLRAGDETQLQPALTALQALWPDAVSE